MTKAEYPRVLRFDLSTVTRNIAYHQTHMHVYQLRT